VSGRVVEVYECRSNRYVRSACARGIGKRTLWTILQRPSKKQEASIESHKQGKAVQSDRRFVAYKSANRKISHPAQKSQEKAVRKRRDDNWRPVMLVGKDASKQLRDNKPCKKNGNCAKARCRNQMGQPSRTHQPNARPLENPASHMCLRIGGLHRGGELLP